MSLRVRHNYRDAAVRMAARASQLPEAIDRLAWRKAIEISRKARELAPKARGELTRSIIPERLGPGRFRVTAGTDYAAVVELGGRPGGWPSMRAIIEWMRVRNIQPAGPHVRDERDLAFVLRRAIARRGTPAQPYLKPAADELWPPLGEQIAQLMARGWQA